MDKLKVDDDIDFSKKILDFQMKLIFIPVGRLIRKITVFGACSHYKWLFEVAHWLIFL